MYYTNSSIRSHMYYYHRPPLRQQGFALTVVEIGFARLVTTRFEICALSVRHRHVSFVIPEHHHRHRHPLNTRYTDPHTDPKFVGARRSTRKVTCSTTRRCRWCQCVTRAATEWRACRHVRVHDFCCILLSSFTVFQGRFWDIYTVLEF